MFVVKGVIYLTTMLILSSVIVLCCVFFNKISDKFGLPALLAFILLGMLFGSDGLFKIEFDNYKFAEEICSVGLVFIIFYGGFGTKWSEAKKVAGKSLILASAGVLLTAFATGAFCKLVLGFEWLESLLIGAVISSTDAASVFSVLRSKKLNLRYGTASILELESGSNDPWAYMLTVIILSVMKGGATAGGFVVSLLAQVFFGVGFGALISLGAVYLIKRVRFDAAGFDAIFVTAIAILSYALPSAVGGNGYLSCYIVGIVLGNTKISGKTALVHFFDGITGFTQILLFFLLGLLAFPSQMPSIILPAASIALFLTFVARPAAVTVIMKPFGAKWKQIALISWAGLRGATSIVFAIMATVDDAYMKNDVFHIVFCIVLMSIGIQGTLLPLFAKKLDMIDDEENVMKTFNDYSDETEVQFIKLSVQPDSNWVGRKIKDIPFPRGLLVVMILRDKEKIIPTGKTEILAGDVVVLSAAGFYDDSHFVLSEMNLDKHHEWCGLKVSEITMSEDSLIVMIKRQGRILIPNGRLRLKEGDVLVVTSG